MKQFSLEEYLKNPSRKVVTRDGRKARIICTDKKGIQPVVALVESDNFQEILFVFGEDGRYNNLLSNERDLFFAPEKREGWVNIYRDAKIGDIPFYKYIYPSEEEAKRNSGPGVIATTKIEWED